MICITNDTCLTIDSSLFETALLQKINMLLQQCCYGKDITQLLDPKQEFRGHYNDEMVVLENYYEVQPDNQGLLRGGCWSLSYILGKRLQQDQEISRQYQIACATGTCPTIFSTPEATHVFLLLWPKAYDEAVRSQLKKSSEEPKPIPEHCLVVCPSFKVIASSQSPHGYTYKILDYYFENMPDPNPDIYNNLAGLPFFPEDGITPLIPLGYLHHLLPLKAIPATMYPDCLIFILFRKNGLRTPPTLELFYVNPNTQPPPRYWKYWRQHLTPDLALRQWIDKIEGDFERADAHIICNQYGDTLKSTYFFPFVKR
jgi:hypothetical protein